MRIEQVTKYKCNGCGTEQQNPIGWLSFVGLMAGGMSYAMTTWTTTGEDFCTVCVGKMRAALNKPDETFAGLPVHPHPTVASCSITQRHEEFREVVDRLKINWDRYKDIYGRVLMQSIGCTSSGEAFYCNGIERDMVVYALAKLLADGERVPQEGK